MNFASYRKQIDKIDRKLLKLFEKRFEISEKIGDYKKQNNIKIQDKKREVEIIKNRTKITKLNKKFVSSLFNLILRESRRLQK